MLFQDTNPPNFDNVPLDEEKLAGKKRKQPRRILHFSDGILEEYSTDEEEDEQDAPAVDPVSIENISNQYYWYIKYTLGLFEITGTSILFNRNMNYCIET